MMTNTKHIVNNAAMVMVFTLSVLVFGTAQTGQTPSKSESPYPNQLPTLKIYEQAKWNSLKPYVSTIDNVENLLGKPVPLFDERLHDDFGFEYDPDWIVVINVVGKGGNLPDSVVGRVLLIRLYPKKRVSLIGADFSAFTGYEYRESHEEGTVYYDKFGLRYVLFGKDTVDGRFHAGDLREIIYGPSEEATARLTQKGEGE